jgi:hypothetical protein
MRIDHASASARSAARAAFQASWRAVSARIFAPMSGRSRLPLAIWWSWHVITALRCLTRNPRPLGTISAPRHFRLLDFVFPDTRGQRPADFETTLKFGIALTRLAAEDPAVHKLTIEVQHLLKPRSVYRDPTLVQRVLAKMAET